MSGEQRSRLVNLCVAASCLWQAAHNGFGREPLSTWPDTSVTPWPEANQLFHRDSRWRGGDGASSVQLGNERILWLFGDSFVSNQPVPKRNGTKMINNSLAIQQGLNPETATFKCYWNDKLPKPQSFFETDDDTWLWPSSGIMLDDKLLILMMHIERAENGFGFRVIGNAGFFVQNPQDSPAQWVTDPVSVPERQSKFIYGSGGLAIEGKYLYAISPTVSKGHDSYLMRWNLSDVRQRDLTTPYWYEDGQWIADDSLKSLPPPTIPGAQSEFTVHKVKDKDCLLQVQCSPYLSAKVGLRFSSRWEGPWSAIRFVYDPRSAGEQAPGVFYYSGKAHPELVADGIAVTYCCNTRSLKQVVNNDSLYYPQFIRIVLDKRGN